jgi:hypothetical protein
MAFPIAVNIGPTVLKVFILIPIIPSNNWIPIITIDNAIKYESEININNPIATKNNEKLLDMAYLALIKVISFCGFDFRQASIENPKLTAELINVKNAQI